MADILKIGIATVEEQRSRTLAIADGQRMRGAEEPHIWFPSVSALCRVVTDENLMLMQAIQQERPDSVEALAARVGRPVSEVSSVLNTLAHCGLVKLRSAGSVVKPEVTFDHLTVELF